MFALVDCNNFYASCERIFNPKIKNTPIVVLSNNDGCVIARSNEAKALGIPMGEPAYKIQHLVNIHNIKVFSSNYTLYGDMSQRVMDTIKTVVDSVEVYSIDEAFVDLSSFQLFDIQDIALEIRQRVGQWVGIPVSVGMAPTKTLAKVANHMAKKQSAYNGICILESESDIQNALKLFPVNEVWGVGRKLSKHLQNAGITTAYDLSLANDSWVKQNFTITGLKMVHELRGISCIPMEKMVPPKQNICTSRSFGKMVYDFETLAEAVSNFAARGAEKLRRQKSSANYVIVFVTTNRFRQDLKQYTNQVVVNLPVASSLTSELIHYALIGLKSIFKEGFEYKKAGVIVSGIVPQDEIQTNLFDDLDRDRHQKLTTTLDFLNKKMGTDTVFISSQRNRKNNWKNRRELLSPSYTTNWNELPEVKADTEILPRLIKRFSNIPNNISRD